MVVNKRKEKRKNRTYRIGYFALPADHKVKTKESEKRNKYLYFIQEQKKKQKKKNNVSMKMTVIPIVNGALGTILKGLVKGLKD